MRRVALLLLATCALLSGCELVADFDRSKIVTDAGPEPTTDSSTPEEDSSVIPPDDEDAGDEDPSDEDGGS